MADLNMYAAEIESIEQFSKASALKAFLIGQIKTKQLPAGQKIPTEFELCQEFNISRTTVRRALNDLVNEGYIYRVRGKGSFVCEGRDVKDFKKMGVTGCTQLIRAQNREPSCTTILQEKIPCEDLLAALMGMELGDPVLKYERVYKADGVPVIYAKSFLNLSVLEGLEECNLSKGSLMDTIMQQYDLEIHRSSTSVRAVKATEEIAGYLNVDKDFPLLYQYHMLDADFRRGKQAIEVSFLYYRTDAIKYTPEA